MKKLLLLVVLSAVNQLIFADTFPEFSALTDQTPGCAIGIVKNQKLVFQQYYGQANLRYRVPISHNTVFDLGSISKHFTAALIIELEQKELLSLKDSLKKYYPQGRSWFEEVKLHHLLDHQSGIPDYLNHQVTKSKLVKRLASTPFLIEQLVVGRPITRDLALGYVLDLVMKLPQPSFKPGERTHYSNTGYVLLANIVEKVTGQAFADFARENIFKPFEMASTELMGLNTIEIPWSATGYSATGITSQPYRRNSANLISQGDGGVFSTLPDFAKWLSHLIDNLPYRYLRDDPFRNGLQVRQLNSGTVYSHGGLSIDAMRSYFWVSPANKIAYVQLCNLNFDKRPSIEYVLESYRD